MDVQQITKDKFWNATLILIKNLGSVYKKISDAIDIKRYKILISEEKNLKLLNSILLDENKKFEDNIQNIENQIQSICNVEEIPLKEINGGKDNESGEKDADNGASFPISDYFRNELNRKSIQGLIFIKKLILKTTKLDSIYCLQVIDFIQKTVSQICLSEIENFKEKLSYEIKLIEKNNIENEEIEIISLNCTSSGLNENADNWFKYVLKPKFLKWMNSIYTEEKSQISSHQLINSEEFSLKYKELKQKYGDYLVKSWTESTDPKKFVYEDISIATYLILLWKKLNEININFIDLGCGNGLLVYLLNSEGYSGYGIDIKRRKIWDKYPLTVKLMEQKIDPFTFNMENDINWIIGNHSDELSAWIPIITSRISYNTKYFLLPCCAYELSGIKFQRRNTKTSVYMDFIKYCENLSKYQCKFITMLDRLKIPSTKRIALIGIKRTYNIEDYQIEIDKLNSYVLNQLNNDNKIKLREKEQIVRNCTQINKDVIDKIVLKIFKILLNDNDDVNEDNNRNDDNNDLHNIIPINDCWNRGISITIAGLVKNFNKNELKILKSECGGLKTLLKNKHEIFTIRNDLVSIKCPEIIKNIDIIKEKMTYKKRKCFFYYNHPNGCPLNADECTFIHDEDSHCE